MTTDEKRVTYRPRNTKSHRLAKDMVFTYWVGQEVARTWERRDYQDVIGELGTVIALPEKNGGSLMVRVDLPDGTSKDVLWSAGECRPMRKLLEGNRDRLRAVANDYRVLLDTLDENGVGK